MKILLAIWRILSLPKNIQLLFMGMRESKFLIGVTGIIFNDKNQVLLMRHTYRKRAWGLPGGYAKSGEHPRETLVREIREESGLAVSADTELKIRTDREASRIEIVFVGKYLTGTFRPSAEVDEARFFAFSDLPLLSRSELMLIKLAYEEVRGVKQEDDMTGNGGNVWQRLHTRLFPDKRSLRT